MPRNNTNREELFSALGVKSVIPTPPGEEPMSAVILKLADPLLKQHGTSRERVETVLALAVAAWNRSMFPPDTQPAIENLLIDCLVPKDGSAAAVGVAIELMDTIADRRVKLYPNLRKLIVDYEVVVSGGRVTMNVTSAPLPNLAESGDGPL